MISLRKLRAMLKENNIRGSLHYNKPELVDVLVKRGFIPKIIKITTSTSLHEPKDTKTERNPKYNFPKHIRNNPQKVEIQHMETD